MTDMAAAVATVLALVCDNPAVVHVGSDMRSTDAVGIYVRGLVDRAEVQRLVEDAPYFTVVVSTVQFGDFTNDTLATKWTRFVARWVNNPNYWPEAMQRYRTRLFEDVQRREEEAFAALDEEAKTQAIADIIARRRDRGARKFGNCWSVPGGESK